MKVVVGLALLVGCGPSVAVPSSTDSDSGGDSQSGPMSIGPATGDTTVVTTRGSGATTEEPRYDVSNSFPDMQECPMMRDVAPLPSSVMVLVDASFSMVNTTLDHDGDPGTAEITRWNMVATALEERLPVLAELAEVGIQSFPNFDAETPPDEGACAAVSDGPGLGSTLAEQLAYLPGTDATFFAGATPTAAGMQLALDELFTSDHGRKRRVLLLTDGAPNCRDGLDAPELFDNEDDVAAPGTIQSGWSNNMFSQVVGVGVSPGVFGGADGEALTDHRAALEGLADVSGRPLLLVDTADELADALSTFEADVTSCRLRIPDDVLHFGSVEVILGGESLPMLSDAECEAGEDGFVYLESVEFDILELCGSRCDAFVEAGVATVVGTCVFPE